MNEVVLALVVAALVGGLVGYSVHRAGSATGPAIEDKDSFLRAAESALAGGRRIVRDLEAVPDSRGLALLDTEDLRRLIGRIDVFASQMSQVTCIAPTSMDARVSRAVAVAATAVDDSFRDERDVRLDPGARRPSASFDDRRSAFAVAVSDLGNHVELL